ncbi:MAG TPA: LpxD N-terminal domain-containing protein [Bacteroidales bacterium]|nr:LpxD N-terminal domain-containing protein [Bacteroidales bacterium]HPT02374.1 LpxD N-terminal domain-containing protein [Bacteroidales bacterium]
MKFALPLTLQQIAAFLQAEFSGDPGFPVKGLNEIHMVEAGDLTFVDHPKYYNKALGSKATTIIINKKVDCPKGKSLIFSEDPFACYVKLAKFYSPFVPASSMLSDSAVIGGGTVIQPGAFVGNHVVIGKNCIIHPGVSIYDGTRIGDNVIIHANSVLGSDAYYFQRKPEGYRKLVSCGRVIIGNNVEIGALCSIDKGVSGDTIISDGVKFDNHVQVGHDTFIGKNCLIGAHTAIAGVTRIEDDVIIWARVSVNKDIVIGKGAVILATSGVDKSLEGGRTYYGVPADEAFKKWREVAAIRKLPGLFRKLQ